MSTTATAPQANWLEAAAKTEAALSELSAERVPLRTSVPSAAPQPPAAPLNRLPIPVPAPILKEKPSPKAVPATDAKPAAKVGEEQQEVDICMRGYAGRALLPGWIICIGLSFAWLIYGVPEVGRLLPPKLVTEELWYGPPAALGLFQLFRWGYRMYAYGFRLTNRRLYRSHGVLYSAAEVLELAGVVKVWVRQHPLEWIMGVGRIRLISEREGPAPVDLVGLSLPKRLSKQIERAVEQAREANVIAK